MNEKKILFFTDIHQNIEAVKKLNFSSYDIIICGGDILDPSRPDTEVALKIIDLLPERTLIVPGNCDKDNNLIDAMKKKLRFIHKSFAEESGIKILGIGYSRSLSEDMLVYRKYFMENISRVKDFQDSGGPAFILDFCGVELKDGSVGFLKYEDALKNASDFMNKFVSFEENEIEKLFFPLENLESGIIITHSPPYGALDKLPGLPNIGSKALAEGIKKIKPGAVLCGHFHELTGVSEINGSKIFNPGALKENRAGEIILTKKSMDFKSILL